MEDWEEFLRIKIETFSINSERIKLSHNSMPRET